MERNAIIAIVLSILVLVVWQQVFIAPQQRRLQAERALQAESEQQTPAPGTTTAAQTAQPQTAEVMPNTAGMTMPTLTPRPINTDAAQILIETPYIQAAITTQGARLISWKTVAHKDVNGAPVEFVSADAQQRGQYPLEIFTGNAALDEELNTGIYRSSTAALTMQAGDSAATVTLTYQTNSGLTVTKSFRFQADSYMTEMTLKVSDPAAFGQVVAVGWGPGLGANLEKFLQFEPEVVSKPGAQKVLREQIKKIDGVVTHSNVDWIAVNHKYFTTALFANNLSNSVSINKVQIQPKDEKEKIEPLRQIVIGLSQASASGEWRTSLYAGPKTRAELKRAFSGFEELIDYGFFRVIADPLAVFMNYLYQYLKNYGLVIIVVTILIKVIFYPLTYKSFSSMKRMQRLQPKMNALREKYKKDSQKLNQEMMNLYKEEGVNPMGGCLPMVLQIPVFFALYQVLSQSIELRGAPFLWVSDLSASETLFFKPLVLLMGASMFLQQSMTPTTVADAKQAQMFKFMPIIFTAMFWNFPAGLVLYWFMNNILTIGQQYLINKKSDDKPAKRADKRDNR